MSIFLLAASSPSTFKATASPLFVSGFSNDPGTVVSAQVAAVSVENAPGPVTFLWEEDGTTSGITITNPSGRFTSFEFYSSIHGVQASGIFKCTVTSGMTSVETNSIDVQLTIGDV